MRMALVIIESESGPGGPASGGAGVDTDNLLIN